MWFNIEADHVSGRFEINSKDIESKLGIPVDADKSTRLMVVENTAEQVQKYLTENFTVSFNGQQQYIEFLKPTIFQETGRFIQYHYRINAIPEDNLASIKNSIFLTTEFRKIDPLHRSLVLIDHNKHLGLDFGKENTAFVFTFDRQEAVLDTSTPPNILVWKDFLEQGVWHIWYGLDHMLFLLVLLLTTVLTRSGKDWVPVDKFREAFYNILKVVTIFTISHSITLALAVLGFVDVPAKPIEVIIALSIVFVAFNNIVPVLSDRKWLLIFAFGLVHGLGFASAMGDLQFRNVNLEKLLLMFNVGVELGQIAIVLLVFPVLFFLRRYKFYSQYVMPLISAASIFVSTVWLGTRLGLWS